MVLKIQNKFISKLPSDTIENNYIRQVSNACFSFAKPTIPSNPKLIHVNTELAKEIGISEAETQSTEFINIFSGKEIYPNTQPFAMNYAGHQFGNWAGQLGDGRAINLFEVNNLTIQLKGSGKTPYSRSADGLAVLRSSIREYLCAEAMYNLGIPTSRSLSLISTGDNVFRDILYDGNPKNEKGAIVARVAPNFIRFGSFEIHAARKEYEILKQITDFTIENFYPELLSNLDSSKNSKELYLKFFKTICDKTSELIIHWQRVGFVHGVMNTDNMSILGITIDYGPYGWLDDFKLNWTPNTTDAQYHRYAYENQPDIAFWNLYQLANALFPLIEDVNPLEEILNDYIKKYDFEYQKMMYSKLGLFDIENENIIILIIQNLQLIETDYTIFFRLLSTVLKDDSSLCAFNKISPAFYSENIEDSVKNVWIIWFDKYLNLIQLQEINDKERKQKMDMINPKYVLHNYMAQLAIEKANNDDFSLINELFSLLQNPYNEQPEYERWFCKRPDWARNKIGCSMLSCSS